MRLLVFLTTLFYAFSCTHAAPLGTCASQSECVSISLGACHGPHKPRLVCMSLKHTPQCDVTFEAPMDGCAGLFSKSETMTHNSELCQYGVPGNVVYFGLNHQEGCVDTLEHLLLPDTMTHKLLETSCYGPEDVCMRDEKSKTCQWSVLVPACKEAAQDAPKTSPSYSLLQLIKRRFLQQAPAPTYAPSPEFFPVQSNEFFRPPPPLFQESPSPSSPPPPPPPPPTSPPPSQPQMPQASAGKVAPPVSFPPLPSTPNSPNTSSPPLPPTPKPPRRPHRPTKPSKPAKLAKKSPPPSPPTPSPPKQSGTGFQNAPRLPPFPYTPNTPSPPKKATGNKRAPPLPNFPDTPGPPYQPLSPHDRRAPPPPDFTFPYCRCTRDSFQDSVYSLTFFSDALCFIVHKALDSDTCPVNSPCCSMDLYKIELQVRPECKSDVLGYLVNEVQVPPQYRDDVMRVPLVTASSPVYTYPLRVCIRVRPNAMCNDAFSNLCQDSSCKTALFNAPWSNPSCCFVG